MKLFKKKDKNIEAEETLAKNAENAKTAADGKNAGAAQETKELSLIHIYTGSCAGTCHLSRNRRMAQDSSVYPGENTYGNGRP